MEAILDQSVEAFGNRNDKLTRIILYIVEEHAVIRIPTSVHERHGWLELRILYWC